MLFELRVGPALGRGCFFDRVAEADVRVGRERVPHQHVGVRLALIAEDLNAVVHAPRAIPAAFDHADGASLELHDRDGFILALRAIATPVRRHL